MSERHLMAGAGFTDADRGPYASELCRQMQSQQRAGLIYRSPGTWVGDRPFWEIDAETRAREILAMEWAKSRNHQYRVECLDPPVRWQYRIAAGGKLERRLHIDWNSLPAWLGDRKRELAMRYRVWRDRGLSNPYAAKDTPNAE